MAEYKIKLKLECEANDQHEVMKTLASQLKKFDIVSVSVEEADPVQVVPYGFLKENVYGH